MLDDENKERNIFKLLIRGSYRGGWQALVNPVMNF